MLEKRRKAEMARKNDEEEAFESVVVLVLLVIAGLGVLFGFLYAI